MPRLAFAPRTFSLGLRASLALLLALSASAVRADRFVLKSGGEIRGQQLSPQSPGDKPRSANTPETISLRTEEGVRLSLARSSLREVVRRSEAEVEYERLAPSVADTAAQQWKLSEWCRQRRLEQQREVHLRRIIELDPDHVRARHALGYSEVNGEWVMQADYLRERGYQLYRGRWRLAQEIEKAEERSKRERAERQWMLRIKRWRGQVASDQGRELARQLAQIRDPRAVPAILRAFQQEPLRSIKCLYLDALQSIGTPEAGQALVWISLNDPDQEVFHECVDRLERDVPGGAVAAYIKALEDKNNVRVNRAAHALGRFGDRQALAPLIAALITQHTVVLSSGGRGAGDTIRSTFARDGGDAAGNPAAPFGGTGLSTGGDARVFHQRVSNREVLEALIRLSGGVTFGFDQRAWRNWLSQEQRRAAPANLQRTPSP